MKRENLIVGKDYLHRRKTVINGIDREAERWIKCKKVTWNGAVFSRYLEPDLFLDNHKIEKELFSHKQM
ncbi:hypothetical protein LKD70_03815 [Ruminococcus sp. CLA-AA-H200]|uniref:Uncharacterized protein n=1 Tax=Ruminococcus turbiniformis TaxID=2881258 RepID=A0ABS8FU39_9FIRM|nr:hypothetical protein [Ruminococcus turbiniformis]MCC2253571.1 hypothetical protein [Ruminococcus turbiniformis]